MTPQRRPDPQRRLANYADVLRHSGFADAQDVAARLVAWQGIFSLARPEVLVADHAPTALLAAQLAGIPHMVIGNGFAISPDVRPWLLIRPWEVIDDATLVAAQERLDPVSEAAQKTLGCSAPVLGRVLFDVIDVLDTFAELECGAGIVRSSCREAMGAGALLDVRADAEVFTTRLQPMLHSPDHRQAAQAFRGRYRQFSPEQFIKRTLAMIERGIVDGRDTLMARHVQLQEISPACLY